MSVKQFMAQIAELEKRIKEQSGDIQELQKEIDRLKIVAFEEEMREDNQSGNQLLQGQCCFYATTKLDFSAVVCYNGGMSEILQEVTIWKSEFPVPNHVYLLDNNDNIIAYIKQGDNVINQLKSNIKLNKRYRKFIKVNHAGLSKLIPKDNGHDYSKKIGVRIFKVISGNHDYKIELDNSILSCTCIGFGYRGKCKHIEAVKNIL